MTTPAEQEAFLDRLESVVARGERISGTRVTGNQSTIKIDAGGVALWIAATACAVMLAINVFMVALYLDQQQQIRDLDAYLSAIYMQAPYLKPPEKKP